MAIRKEWTEWHLTPRGWEQGSTRREGRGNQWRDEPADRLLSYQHIEIHGSAGQPSTTEPKVSGPKTSTPRISTEETWRTKDPAALQHLEAALTRYGAAPSRLD